MVDRSEAELNLESVMLWAALCARENVTAKRETKSILVFGEKHGPIDADCFF